MKRLNIKGFTLTEILATLIILGVIIAIAIPSYNNLSKKFRDEYYDKLDNTVLTSAKTYYKDHSEKRPVNILETEKVAIEDLDLESDAKSYKDEGNLSGYVRIVNVGDEYEYKTCLTVKDNEDKILWSSYDQSKTGLEEDINNYCNGDVWDEEGTLQETYEDIPGNQYLHVIEGYTNTKKNSSFLRDILGKGKSIQRKMGGRVYKTEKLPEGSLYPKNVTHISLATTTDDPYSVEYDGEDENGASKSKVHVVQHEAPELYYETGTKIEEGGTVDVSQSIYFLVSNNSFKNTVSEIKTFQYTEDDGKNWMDFYEDIPSCAEVEVEGNNYYKCNINSDAWDNLLNNESVKFRVVGKYKSVSDEAFNQYGKSNETGYNIEECTIKYDANGGTGTMSDTKICTSGTTLAKNTFTRTGYKFIGWGTNPDGMGKIYADQAPISELGHTSGILTLYAIWEANEYTVTFDGNGGTINMEEKTVYYGSAYDELAEANRTGYTFEGWYTARTGGTKIEATTIVSTLSDHTLYAHWTANTYTISYGSNLGLGTMSDTTCTYDETCILSSNEFTKIGNTFKGWSTSVIASDVDYANRASVKNLTDVNGEEIKLYAVWEANKYTVTFDPNGGTLSGNKTKTVTYGKLYGTMPGAVRNGYTFEGWYTSKWIQTFLNKKSSLSIVTSTENHTLYAKWEEVAEGEPSIAILATDGSYNSIPSGTTVTKGIKLFFNGMVNDDNLTNKVSKVEISYEGGSYSECSTIQAVGDSGRSTLDEKNPSYKSYKRYYCGTHTFNNTGDKTVKLRVTYNNTNKVLDYSLTVSGTLACPTITISPAVSSSGWYTTSPITVTVKPGSEVSYWEWYTNTTDTADLTINNIKFKYWKEITGDGSGTLGNAGDFKRYYLVRAYNAAGQYIDCQGGPYQIDGTKPTLTITMKKMGTETANANTYKNYSSKPNYTYSTTGYNGNVLVTVSATDKGGVKSVTCTPSGADANRNSTSFSTYRNVSTNGTTTIKCTATDKAGNTTTSSVKINIMKSHTHKFGTSFNAISDTYKNYKIGVYKWTNISSTAKNWTCTKGHTHHYANNINAAHMQCVICGKTAYDLGYRDATWWCPCDARAAGFTQVNGYGC